MVPVGVDASTVDELNSGEMPVAVLDRPVARLRAATFLADNSRGAEMVTNHLIAHGHRAIGCLAGPEPLAPSTERLAGWAKAVAAAGLSKSGCPVERARVGRQAAYEAALRLLDGKKPPTAVFATTDEQAIGVLRAAADVGRQVPADLAVAGFDGIAQGAFCVPGLTTAQQPIEEMARSAVAAVLAHVGDSTPTRRRKVFPVELVRRGSCGCPDQDGR
jgi:LacI family transcriptional regulator